MTQTPEQTAAWIVVNYARGQGDDLSALIAAAIRAAVAAETERCADIADNLEGCSASYIAERIRGAPPPQETQT